MDMPLNLAMIGLLLLVIIFGSASEHTSYPLTIKGLCGEGGHHQDSCGEDNSNQLGRC